MTARAYYNDHDPGACEWLRELIKAGQIADGDVDERSILDVRPEDLLGYTQCHFFAGIGGWSLALRLAEWPDTKPVWTGSPPCQPFSVAGRNLGADDPRHLAPHFLKLVRTCRPPVLFGEQVASAEVFGSTAKKVAGAFDGPPPWAWIDDVSNILEAAHYATGASDIPSAGVGAPHERQRTFFGAYDIRSAASGLGDASSPRSALGIPATAGRYEGDAKVTDDRSGGLSGPDAGRSGTDRMANANSDGAQRIHGDPKKAPRLSHEERGTEHHASIPKRSGEIHHGPADCGSHGLRSDDNGTGQGNSFWGSSDLLFCRDGKWRPVEPGTFPLAHGLSGRMGLLRGYGNAINPWAAKEFIQALEYAATQTVIRP